LRYEINCPHCDQNLEADEAMLGKESVCPVCGHVFQIPEALGNEEEESESPFAVHAEATDALFRARTRSGRKGKASATPEPVARLAEPIGTAGRNTRSMPGSISILLGDEERVLYASNPSVAAMILSIVIGMLVAIVPAFPLAVALTEGTDVRLGIAVIGMLVGATIGYLNWSNLYYVITETRTIVRQGIFNVTMKIVFNHNIQLISINTGIIDRLLDLNSVELSTAAQGGAGGILGSVPGLARGGVYLKWVKIEDVLKHYALVRK
jgi:membrane protein YdbS with pleckstrin-like domain